MRYSTLFCSKNRLAIFQKEKDIIRPLSIEPTLPDGSLNAACVYFTIPDGLTKILCGLDECSRNGIRSLTDMKIDAKFPQEISTEYPIEKVIETHCSAKIDIAIINGMSLGTGDHIIGMAALENLYEKLTKRYAMVNIDLYQEISPDIVTLNKKYTCIRNWYFLPEPIINLLSYDFYIDLSQMCGRPGFDTMPMVDWYLDNIGLNHKEISDEKKRTNVKLNLKTAEKLEPLFWKLKGNDKFILFHHRASTKLRSIPDDIAKKLVNYIIENTDCTVVSLLPDFYISHDRFLNLSGLSNDYDDYIYLVSQMDEIVCTDTSVYHIADSFDIPSRIIFTSINPELRIKYYPYTKAYRLNLERLNGKHISESDFDEVMLRKLWGKKIKEVQSFCITEFDNLK